MGTVNCSGKAMEPGPGAEEWYGWIGLGRACRLFVHGTEGGGSLGRDGKAWDLLLGERYFYSFVILPLDVSFDDARFVFWHSRMARHDAGMTWCQRW